MHTAKKLYITLSIFIWLCATAPGVLHAQTHPLFDSLSNYDAVRIDKVLRSDLIVLESGEKIRLIGIKSPPAPKREKPEVNEFGIIIRKKANPITSIEERSFSFAQNLLEGKTVRLELDAQTKDDDMYTLAYVFLDDGTLVNAEIIRQGLARLKIRPPNTRYTKQLRAAYQEARREKRGLQGE